MRRMVTNILTIINIIISNFNNFCIFSPIDLDVSGTT